MFDISQNTIPIVLVNKNKFKIEIGKGKFIGKLEKCDEKSILNVKSSANSSERCASSLINIDKHIPVVQSKQLKQLCDDYDKIFSKHENDLGFYDKTQFDICTGDHKPIKNRPYRVPYAHQETVNKMIDDMLNHKIISKSIDH